jgi:hypothetical protein
VRLKGYGDKGVMRDVAEIVVPAGMPPVKSMKVSTVPDRPHDIRSVDVEFHDSVSIG